MRREGLKRAGVIVLATLVITLVGVHLALFAAVPLIEREALKALGAGGSIKHIGIGWFSLRFSGLSVAAPQGWPTAYQLRVARIDVALGASALAGLLEGELSVGDVTLVKPRLAARRTENGHMEVLPGVIASSESAAPASAPTRPAVKLKQITINDGAFEFFDASVAQPALTLRFEAIEVTLRDVTLPSLTGHSAVEVTAVFKGTQHDGSIDVSGWTELATRDSALKAKLRGIDLLALEPYLIKASGKRHGHQAGHAGPGPGRQGRRPKTESSRISHADELRSVARPGNPGELSRYSPQARERFSERPEQQHRT